MRTLEQQDRTGIDSPDKSSPTVHLMEHWKDIHHKHSRWSDQRVSVNGTMVKAFNTLYLRVGRPSIFSAQNSVGYKCH
jgi:hypothetical protein